MKYNRKSAKLLLMNQKSNEQIYRVENASLSNHHCQKNQKTPKQQK